MKYEKNVITVSLENYRHYWRGIPKIGKTTLFRDLVIAQYGKAEGGLLISPGNETGYKALSNLYGIEAPTWEDFVDIIDDLVENKTENEFKIVAVDTVDELVSIASDKVLKIHFQRKGEKVQTLNQCLGGYGAGHTMVQKLINDQIRRLESSGYGLIFISHTKVKDVKEKGADESYQQLTGSMESRFDKIFTDKADIIATLTVDKNIQDERLIGSERFIYFRSDNFVDAGTRFPDIPERVQMNAEEYIKAFEHGVRSSFDGKVTEKTITKMREEETKVREEKAKEFTEKSKTGDIEHASELNTPEDYRKLITEKISAFDKDTKKQKQAETKELGLPTAYKTIEDIDVLKKILKLVSN